jgi:hypothetical protein
MIMLACEYMRERIPKVLEESRIRLQRAFRPASRGSRFRSQSPNREARGALDCSVANHARLMDVPREAHTDSIQGRHKESRSAMLFTTLGAVPNVEQYQYPQQHRRLCPN